MDCQIAKQLNTSINNFQLNYFLRMKSEIDFELLCDSNKVTRRKELEKVLSEIDDENDNIFNTDVDDKIRMILKCMTDKYERCR